MNFEPDQLPIGVPSLLVLQIIGIFPRISSKGELRAALSAVSGRKVVYSVGCKTRATRANAALHWPRTAQLGSTQPLQVVRANTTRGGCYTTQKAENQGF